MIGHYPDDEKHLIEKVLKEEVYAQVATLEESTPKVRTIGLSLFDRYQTIGFETHTDSPKWQQLSKNSNIAGCHFSSEYSIQLRFEGRAKLIKDAKDAAEADWLDKRWQGVCEYIRKESWKDFN